MSIQTKIDEIEKKYAVFILTENYGDMAWILRLARIQQQIIEKQREALEWIIPYLEAQPLNIDLLLCAKEALKFRSMRDETKEGK